MPLPRVGKVFCCTTVCQILQPSTRTSQMFLFIVSHKSKLIGFLYVNCNICVNCVVKRWDFNKRYLILSYHLSRDPNGVTWLVERQFSAGIIQRYTPDWAWYWRVMRWVFLEYRGISTRVQFGLWQYHTSGELDILRRILIPSSDYPQVYSSPFWPRRWFFIMV